MGFFLPSGTYHILEAPLSLQTNKTLPDPKEKVSNGRIQCVTEEGKKKVKNLPSIVKSQNVATTLLEPHNYEPQGRRAWEQH